MAFHIEQPITLTDRAFIEVSGTDAAEFLQGQISNDVDLLKTQNSIHALILTPQGKILADMFVYNHDKNYLLDVHISVKDWLLKRFNMFKLRSDVNFNTPQQNQNLAVTTAPLKTAQISTPDPRTANIYRNLVEATDKLQPTEAYHHHMASQAFIEFGTNYQASEFFPQDIWFDKLSSISFTKGCYVGQEVVSRMRHKSTARKRLLPLISDKTYTKADKVLFNQKAIGEVICQVGNITLAMMRMDKLPTDQQQLDDFKIARPEWIQNL